MEYLFVYGTLTDAIIQKELFGRRVNMKKAELEGFKKGEIRIPDTSQGTIYPIITRAEKSDLVSGRILELSSQELSIADRYEGPNYKRQQVQLTSGTYAWTYTSK